MKNATPNRNARSKVIVNSGNTDRYQGDVNEGEDEEEDDDDDNDSDNDGDDGVPSDAIGRQTPNDVIRTLTTVAQAEERLIPDGSYQSLSRDRMALTVT